MRRFTFCAWYTLPYNQSILDFIVFPFLQHRCCNSTLFLIQFILIYDRRILTLRLSLSIQLSLLLLAELRFMLVQVILIPSANVQHTASMSTEASVIAPSRYQVFRIIFFSSVRVSGSPKI